jgi:hypothetical protein
MEENKFFIKIDLAEFNCPICNCRFPLKIKGTDLSILDFSYKFARYIILKNTNADILIVLNFEHIKSFFLTNDIQYAKPSFFKQKSSHISEEHFNHQNKEAFENAQPAIEKDSLEREISDIINTEDKQLMNNKKENKLSDEETLDCFVFLEAIGINGVCKISIQYIDDKFFIAESLNKRVLLKISQPLQFNSHTKKIKLIKGNLRMNLIRIKRKFEIKSLPDFLCFGK